MMKKKLGELLIESGAITNQQLMEALKDQQAFGGRLGTILLEKCFIKEEEYFRVLSSILGIPSVNLSNVTIPEAVLKTVPMEVAWNNMVLPVEIKKSPKKVSLLLAMADPMNVVAVNEVQAVSNYKIEPALALESTIRFVLMDYYQNQYGKGDYHLGKKVVPKCADADSSIYKVSDSIDREPARESILVNEVRGQAHTHETLGLSDTVKSGLVEDMLLERFSKLHIEMKALFRLLSRKGLINSKEYMEVLREIKASEHLK